MTNIRPLKLRSDRALVAGLYARAEDYVFLETGMPPDDTTVTEFFTDAPPGADLARSHKAGLFVDGTLAGIADLGFGFPDRQDAYLGLMLFAPEFRNMGLGQQLVSHVTVLARAGGAARMLLAVLDDNADGKRFWQRQGFRAVFRSAPMLSGERMHVRIRMERRI